IQAVLFLPEHSPRAAGSVEQLTNLLQRRVLLGEDSNRAPPLHHVGQRRVGAADSAQIWGGQRNGPVGGWPGKIQWPVALGQVEGSAVGIGGTGFMRPVVEPEVGRTPLVMLQIILLSGVPDSGGLQEAGNG